MADNKVLIPILRRTPPGLIATRLLGVQSMTGPVGSIFGLKVPYSIKRIRKIFCKTKDKSYVFFQEVVNVRIGTRVFYLSKEGYFLYKLNGYFDGYEKQERN